MRGLKHRINEWLKAGKSTKSQQRAGRVAQVGEHLLSKHEALNSKPSTKKKILARYGKKCYL
jgi:primosomal protein N''